MGNCKGPGPVCSDNSDAIDDGTLCLSASPLPGPVCVNLRQVAISVNLALDPNYHPIKGRNGLLIGYFRSSGGYSEVVNTDGEIVWTYEIPLERDSIPILDPALDAIGAFVIGTIDTVMEDNWSALGLTLDDDHRAPFAKKLGIPPDAIGYRLGRGGGHLISLLQAAAEVVGGATLFVSGAGETVAGVATTPAGIGVVVLNVGVVSMATGTTVIIHGGVLGKAVFMNAIEGGGGGGGGDGPTQPGIRPAKRVPRVREKTTTFKGGSPSENFGKARADAIAQAKLKPDKIPFKADAGPPREIGRIKGTMNPDGVSGGWRLDFDPGDPTKGLHINWWRMENGTYIEGANIIEGGTQDLYWEILSHFPLN
jgi:hypothetical protein